MLVSKKHKRKYMKLSKINLILLLKAQNVRKFAKKLHQENLFKLPN